jgi:hypothetical protein
MAVIDPRNETVVIRVVYDGAPMAGKSTSLRALGKGLAAGVVSPAEMGGRTLYFDWLDYTGGLFEGRRIRCQVISVPGQATLAPRRRRLLESADVIVFVSDSSPEAFDADRAYLSGLCRVLGNLKGPPVGIVLQANKRDHPAAIPIVKVRSMLDGLEMQIGVIEAVAIDGSGVREAFVFAVRLALDRVRELMRDGQLRTIPPQVDSAQDLLEELQRGEDGSLDLAAVSGLVHTRLTEVQPQSVVSQVLTQALRDNEVFSAPITSAQSPEDDAAEPAPPDQNVASGMIWPPVDGRLILHELAAVRVRLSRSALGDWSGTVNGRWRIHSPAQAVFRELEHGRTALVQSARIHAARAGGKSIDRCVVLAADGRGKFRVWQIARI